jgi:4'-phosphopantetheinyl transferase EntD/uncharacterized protein YbdZ (MbtH family)
MVADLAGVAAWAARVLPTGCAVAWTPAQDAPPALDVEEALVARAVESRRAEFRAGRWCARRALDQLGVAPAPILRGPGGEPLWPRQVVGSISHAQGRAIAVAGPAARMVAVGLDVESAAPLDAELVARVCRPEERAVHPALQARGIDKPKLVFVAKEAAYKALFPRDGRFREFHDLRIIIDPAGEGFGVEAPGGDDGDGVADLLIGRVFSGNGWLAALAFAPVVTCTEDWMSDSDRDGADGRSIDGDLFIVLVNAEDQHSIWPARKSVPEGWSRVGPQGSRQACLDFVEANWTDMRPRSLRQAMEATGRGDA